MEAAEAGAVKAFADLYAALDATTKTNEKIAAMSQYFRSAPPEDIAWAVHFLIGRRPKRLIATRDLVSWAIEEAGMPEWMFGECYQAVGDLAETIALLLPAARTSSDKPLRYWVEERLLPLRDWDDAARRASMIESWREMSERQRFAWNKLITGEFRVGVSQNLVVRALAEASGVDANVLAHRLMGEWQPTADFATQILAKETADADVSRPYPFCLAYPLEGEIEELGDVRQWQVEWKWDGIRSQMIRRSWQTFLWSRGEELVTDRFPELAAAGALLPEGTVLDGEVLPWKDGAPLPFTQMQRRIGRKELGAKILAEVPVVLIAFDLLEHGGRDVREQPLEWRRAELEKMIGALGPGSHLIASPLVDGASWEDLKRTREEARAAWCRRVHAEAARFGLSRRTPPRRLVEVEDQSILRGCRADLRASRAMAGAPACSRTTRSAFGTAVS